MIIPTHPRGTGIYIDTIEVKISESKPRGDYSQTSNGTYERCVAQDTARCENLTLEAMLKKNTIPVLNLAQPNLSGNKRKLRITTY